MRFLEENPDVSLVGCATVAIDERGHPIRELGISQKPATEEEVSKTILLAAPCLHIWMTWSEVYRKLSGYRGLLFAEDYDFLLRAFSAGYRISNIAEPLMKIRTRSGNMSSRIEQRKAHYYILRLYRERLKYGHDSFNQTDFAQVVKAGRVENCLFQAAIWCVKKGLRSSSRIVCGLFTIASALLSPWQARYFLGRLRYKLAIRSTRRAAQFQAAANCRREISGKCL